MRATIESAATFVDLRDKLASSLAPAATRAQAEQRIVEWARETVAESDELLSTLQKTNTLTRLAGQLFVRDIEIGDKVRKLEATGETAGTFLNLPFTEAIEHFGARNILPADEFDALIDSERLRAFTLRRAVSDGVARDALRRLNAAMQPEGAGMGEFINSLSGSVDGAGFPGGVRSYLETVYRTTTATSYNAGRYRQQFDPDVLASGGLWLEYRTAGDSRVRTDHALLDGKQWEPNDAALASVYPPNGFNCRCVVAITDERNADQLSREVDTDAAISDGFRTAPGATIENES